MKIIVPIKQVPETGNVKMDEKTGTMIREGVESIVNPLDLYAIECALQLKEQFGGNISVLSMGPPKAEKAIREALSMGCDDGVLLTDKAFAGSDTWATSYVLSKAIAKIANYDIIICGRQTLDGDTGQVGPELSEMLKIPFVSYVSKIEEIKDKHIRVQRMIEEGHEVIETTLPAVITVVKEINVPRLPSLRGSMKAKTAKIPVWNAAEIGAEPDKAGIPGSPTRVVKIFYPKRTHKSEIFQGTVEEQISQLAERLEKII